MTDKAATGAFAVEDVPLDRLTAHPENYRAHPAAQLEHLEASVRQFGVYKNVVARRDGTILAGHGVIEAARRAGLQTVPVHWFDGSEAEARKLLVSDNTVSRLAEDDAGALAALLADLSAEGELSGTGYDDAALAELLSSMVGGENGAHEEFDPSQVPEREFDENLDLSKIKTATCPECGHEFPV